MNKFQLDCFYYKKKLQHHKEIKTPLLSLIEDAEYDPCIDLGCDTDITKTDWKNSDNFERPWVKFLNQYLLNEILESYKDCGYDGFTLHEIWFQQYVQNSKHGWHTHSSNFTSVYYLELPDGTPKTQLVNPYNQSTIIEPEIEEGDILIFPSFVLHKAPPNLSEDQKTIISFNTNVTYSNEIYGKGLE